MIDDYSSAYGDVEKTGHFYPVKFKDKYFSKQISLSGSKNGDKTITPTVEDPFLIVRLENLNSDKLTAKVDGTGEEVFELDFSGTTRPNVKVMNQSEQVGYGKKLASDLMNDDVSIKWDGTTGVVSGTFKKVTDWSELPKDPHEGYFFAMRIDEKYLGKPFTFIKEGSDPSTVQEASKDELFWILCIDDKKKYTFKSDNDVIAILDFSGVTLEPQ